MARYFVLAALTQLVWSLTPSASKIVLLYLPVEAYSAIRYSFSGLLFLAYSLMTRKRFRGLPRDWPALVGLGILTYAMDSLGTLYGLKLGGVLNFGLASSLNGVVTALVAVVFLREKVNSYFPVVLALSVLGGLLLFWGKYGVSNFEIAGGSLALIWLAYFFEALGFVYSKKFKPKYSLPEYLAVLQLSAGAFMWGLCGVTGHGPSGLASMPGWGWACLLFVCLVACAGCYLVLYWLLNFVDGHKLAFFDCFHSGAAAMWGMVFFSEALNAKMLAGGGCLLFALILVTQKTRDQAERLVPVIE